MAEDEALASERTQIVLDTHSFQAPRFYERLGFKIISTHSGYLRGHQKHYMSKQLTW